MHYGEPLSRAAVAQAPPPLSVARALAPAFQPVISERERKILFVNETMIAKAIIIKGGWGWGIILSCYGEWACMAEGEAVNNANIYPDTYTQKHMHE